MTAKERLEWVINYSGLNQFQFAKHLSVSPGTINAIITTGKTKTISRSLARKICEGWPEINIDWLLYGSGEMLLVINHPAEKQPIVREDAPVYTRNMARIIEYGVLKYLVFRACDTLIKTLFLPLESSLPFRITGFSKLITVLFWGVHRACERYKVVQNKANLISNRKI